MKSAILIILASLIGFTQGMAQTTATSFDQYRAQKRAEFERYKQEKRTEFEQYRQRLNEEYAKMISGEWQNYKERPREKPVTRPKPLNPTKAPKDETPQPRTMPVKVVTPPEKPIPDVPVTIPKVLPESRKDYPVNFIFYNTPCGIREFDVTLLSLGGTDNKSLGKAWQSLTADGNLDDLVDDCMRLREELNLCDWGYLLLTEKVAATFYPESSDKQTFMMTTLLSQSGYDCRMATKNGKLGMMYHPSHTVFGIPYYMIDNRSYYIYGNLSNEDGSLQTYNGNFCDNPTPIRMVMDRYPRFVSDESKKREFSSASWKGGPPIRVSVNPTVIDFMKTYPQVNWHLYGLAAVSDELYSTLYQAMDLLTEGLSEEEAVNLILNFHHYGYKYMTDDEQFGKEKPFFFDENFFYPYNDCEDRAIMFSRLVRDILKLDVVYLELPNHLAAAVRFSPESNVKGATVKVDEVDYVVCDPTYIGAKVGMLPHHYLDAEPIVHKISL